MKRSSIRAFGIACFLIGALLTASNQLHLPLVKNANSETDVKQYKDEISSLEEQLKEAKEEILMFKQNKQPDATTKETSSNNDTEQQPSQETVTEEQPKEEFVTGTLYIYPGLTPADVAQKIKDLGVINNSIEMELFLAQREYARSIQTGQYELNSSMTIEEIANTITGKKTE